MGFVKLLLRSKRTLLMTFIFICVLKAWNYSLDMKRANEASIRLMDRSHGSENIPDENLQRRRADLVIEHETDPDSSSKRPAELVKEHETLAYPGSSAKRLAKLVKDHETLSDPDSSSKRPAKLVKEHERLSDPDSSSKRPAKLGIEHEIEADRGSLDMPGECKEHQHVYFLKVHKAGSTTIQNVFWRFAVTRALSVTVFKKRFPFPNPDFQSELLPNPTFSGFDGRYDMFCEHSKFNPKQLAETMKPDTKNVAILREPVARFRSGLKYYGYGRHRNLTGDVDLVEHWLNNKKAKVIYLTARQFGWTEDMDFESYIEEVSPMFSVVMILEQLDESLILMKRRLCWKFKDIIYLPMRKQAYAKPDEAKEHKQREQFRNIAPNEYTLYEHFKKKLNDEFALEENDFSAEVATFVKITDETQVFCTKVCQQLGDGVKANASHDTMLSYLQSTVRFEATAWEPAFEVSGLECIMNMFDPGVYRKSQVITQYPGICSKPVDGVQVKDLYCHEHFAYSFPWDLIYVHHRKSTFLYDCY